MTEMTEKDVCGINCHMCYMRYILIYIMYFSVQRL